jgi:hypothetical protein
MNQDQQTEFVRREVTETFQDLGATSLDCLIETLLIRDGFYCGRRFYCDGFQAVWFLEERQIKYFNDEGQLVRKSAAASCLSPPSPVRKAASG